VSEILTRLSAPDSWSVAAYLAGIYCVATAAGIATGVQLAQLSLPSPQTRIGKVLMCAVGLSLLAFGIGRSLRFPEYKPAVFERWAYQGPDAKQIASDGQDVYLLRQNGNIYRISDTGLALADDGTGTRQILPAGGILYILKNNGNIWVYQAISGSPAFQIADPGTGTSQIESSGEILYVLKENGNIWKSVVCSAGENSPLEHTKFVRIDDGTDTKQLSSSGSILYILKKAGNIWKYAPALGQSFEEIYTSRNAEWIKADGGALYFIRDDGTPCKYRERLSLDDRDATPKREGSCIAITEGIRARKIDALGGVVYILTNENRVFRYNAETDDLREVVEAGSDNRSIAAYNQDLFAIKTDGSVKRYNEGRLRR
jgi:hypothetical protein